MKKNGSLIISNSLVQQIMSRVYDASHVNSVFIFCNNKNYHEEWAKDWSKMKDGFTEIQQCQQSAISSSITGNDDALSSKDLDQLVSFLIYTDKKGNSTYHQLRTEANR